jgi:hypothetical protein
MESDTFHNGAHKSNDTPLCVVVDDMKWPYTTKEISIHRSYNIER